jgi:hypothetical protein
MLAFVSLFVSLSIILGVAVGTLDVWPAPLKFIVAGMCLAAAFFGLWREGRRAQT